MIVDIDEQSGFCYGVIRAIETIEGELRSDNELFSLGEIVHNNMEVHRLEAKGLQTINHAKMKTIKGHKMIIRAHGEPPETYIQAKNNNITVVDCTCPVVLKLQERIKQSYEETKKINGQIVIFGKHGHAEVNGLVGQTNGEAIVIENIGEIDKIDFSRPISLFSQTTKGLEEFEELRRTLLNRMIETLGKDDVPFESHNTICRQVANRKPHLVQFAKKHDVIIFVSGKQSSNGKVLYQACKTVNDRTHLVECSGEIQKKWFESASSVGVCGATSTPKWLMEEVANEIRKLNNI